MGLMMLLTGMVSAENVKGKVTDAQGNPMPFVTISVLAQDSTLLTGTITDEQGKYTVESPSIEGRGGERFLIQASYIGYHTAFGGPDFVLHEESERLAEVEKRVSASRKWKSKPRNRLSSARWTS